MAYLLLILSIVVTVLGVPAAPAFANPAIQPEAAPQPGAEEPAQPDAGDDAPEPAETEPPADDPRRGVPTRDFRDIRESDRRVNDRILAPGLWRGWLTLPSGHELALTLDVDFHRDHFRDPVYAIRLRNGTDTSPASVEAFIDPETSNQRVRIGFPDSGAVIEASPERGGLALAGEYIYERTTDGVAVEYRVPFTAANADGRRYDTPDPAEPEAVPELNTDWRVTFESRQGPAVMSLRLLPDGRHVQGTVATPTGDDGVLFGVFHENRLRLSRFTGTSGLLYEAALQPDGSLIGTFHSLAHHSETFTATPSRDAALPDLFEQTRWIEGVRPADLAFRDTTGEMRTVGDIAGGPSLLYIFGTWCHNCSDATRYLNELHADLGDRLPIVGIAFESPSDFEAQADRVRRYVSSKGVPFPVLVAGQRDKSSATETLGALDRLRAYPTFVFVDDRGEVAAVHQGFIGPADPDRHAALLAAFAERIEALLAGG